MAYCGGVDGHFCVEEPGDGGHLAASPSSPPSDVGGEEGFTLLPHPLLLSHGNPPPGCTLLGSLSQVSHPGQHALALCEP